MSRENVILWNCTLLKLVNARFAELGILCWDGPIPRRVDAREKLHGHTRFAVEYHMAVEEPNTGIISDEPYQHPSVTLRSCNIPAEWIGYDRGVLRI